MKTILFMSDKLQIVVNFNEMPHMFMILRNFYGMGSLPHILNFNIDIYQRVVDLLASI